MASSTRSALLKVMVNRYMKKHGLDDAPDKSNHASGGGGDSLEAVSL